MLLLGIGTAQARLIKEHEKADSKYLEGAVPEEDGKVVFSQEIDIPKEVNIDSLNSKLNRWAGHFFNANGAMKRTRLSDGSDPRYLEIGVVQYMVFRQTNWVLDRTQIIYRVSLRQHDDKLQVRMSNIEYYYDEERSPEKFDAESSITDRYCLTRDKSDLVKKNGKFRIKTIDLFDDICHDLVRFVNTF